MCELCQKVDILKDILMSYFTDEEIRDMNTKAGMPGFDIPGSRLSVAIMAVVELCLDHGLSPNEMHEGMHVAIMRDAMRRRVIRDNPNSTHSIKERIRGYES